MPYSRWLPLVDVGARFLAAVAILLPAVGFLERVIVFAFSRGVPSAVWYAASPAEFVFSGFRLAAIDLPLAALLLYVFGHLAVARGSMLELERRKVASDPMLDKWSADSKAWLDETEHAQAELEALQAAVPVDETAVKEALEHLQASIRKYGDMEAANEAVRAELAAREAILARIDATLAMPISGLRGVTQVGQRIPPVVRQAALRIRAVLPSSRWRGWLWITVMPGIGAYALVAPLASVVIYFIGGSIAWFWAMRVVNRGSSRVVVLPLIPALAIFLAATAVATGLTPTSLRGEYLIPAANQALVAGWYTELGRTDAAVYLQSCDNASAPVFAVPPSAIAEIVYAPDIRLTVGGLLGNSSALGYVAGCNHP